VQGTFAGINWSQTVKFLQVEVDTGLGWITMGNQQLMSVPYALYAANGPQGPQGPQGETGPQGAPGATGPQGPTGNGAFTHYVGELFGGGIVFHVYRDDDGTEHGLIAYPEALGLDEPFGDYDTIMNNCTNDWDGRSNTECLASLQSLGIARMVSDFAGNGCTDWYIPSVTEFDLLKGHFFHLRKRGFLADLDFVAINSRYFWTSTALEYTPSCLLAIASFHGTVSVEFISPTPPGVLINNWSVFAIRNF
jgi:hypothetical protein